MKERLEVFTRGFDVMTFIKSVSHYKPNLRVLEIGSSHIAKSKLILEELSRDGRQLYSKYTFTARGIIPSQAQTAKHVNIQYSILDLEKDPLEQGFEAGQYDLIVARNVLDRDTDVHASLTNMRELLSFDGYLLFEARSSGSGWLDYIFGSGEEWRYGIEGLMDDDFTRAGLSVADNVVLDLVSPHHVNIGVIAKHLLSENTSKRASLLVWHDCEDVKHITQSWKHLDMRCLDALFRIVL
ncbi:hypothetical protein K491DRAFT_606161 [Lophiostoma macrostomum CBS 122681]|uniref:Methyltransferase type 12 domain-containing protein n=1 Tax=Lophiostoma macrostomum CBS 122681 TaxID=1314788 RepID=A0A6A6SZV5_9PLEO|nr:hypothetical protein K491DRAFT_606161 [Lophiostoma macrostomum CBS 122681]